MIEILECFIGLSYCFVVFCPDENIKYNVIRNESNESNESKNINSEKMKRN